MRLGNIARAIWNGPFYIGALQRPITIGEVSLKVLETIWRGVIASLGVLLAVMLSVGAYLWLVEATSPVPLWKMVKVEVEYGGKIGDRNCEAPYPLLLKISNHDKTRKVASVSLRIDAFRPQRSTNLAEYNDPTSDEIIEPQTATLSCWRVPKMTDSVDAASLEYRVRVFDAVELKEK